MKKQITKLTALALALIMCLSLVPITAFAADPENPVSLVWPLDISDIADPAMREYVRIFAMTGSDPSTWDELSREEADSVTEFTIPGGCRDIGHFIHHRFQNIEYLDASLARNLTELDLFEMRDLKNINFSNGLSNLVSLDVRGCSSLEILNLMYSDSLESLEAGGCSSLEYIRVNNSKLTELDVHGLSSLAMLDINNNHISSLDVSGCTGLTSINVYSNEFSDLSSISGLDGLNNLETLSLERNRFSDLSVGNLPKLVNLDVDRNELGSFILTNLPNLEMLSCAGCGLDTLDISAFPKLGSLFSSDNHLFDVSFGAPRGSFSTGSSDFGNPGGFQKLSVAVEADPLHPGKYISKAAYPAEAVHTVIARPSDASYDWENGIEGDSLFSYDTATGRFLVEPGAVFDAENWDGDWYSILDVLPQFTTKIPATASSTYDVAGHIMFTTIMAAAAPSITTQPTNQSVAAGQSAAFTVVATGDPAPTYQWEISTNGGGSWTSVTNGGIYSGTTSATLTLTAVPPAASGNQYRCHVANNVGFIKSNVATLTVTSAADNSSATIINLEDTWFGAVDYDTYSASWEYDYDTNTIFAYASVTVTGTVSGVANQLTLDIDSGKTVTWQAAYSGSHSDYLVKPTGSGATFTVANGSIVNSGTGGCIVVNAGAGPSIRVNTGGMVSGSGYAIYSANSVSVNGGTVSSISGTTTSAAICAAAGDVTVTSGSTVSATAGRGIYSSNATVSVTGGTVSATTGSAIYANPLGGYASAISVSGGTVSATDGFAINTADSATSTVAVNSGFVFAYGTDLSYVIAMNGSSTPTIGGSGVVTAWNQAAGVTSYAEGAADDLVSNPAGAATWHKDGAASGIKYGSSGFFPIAGVSVATAIPTISITNISVTGANMTVYFNLSEDATVWRMYKLASEPAPTEAEIKGFGGGGSAGTAGANYRGQGMLDSPGFQLNTLYTWYMVAENAAGTSTIASDTFTTHPGYVLTIQAGTGGTIITGTSGNYPYGYGLGGPGTTIDIDAAANANYTFSGWTTSNGGSFADANSASTTFTMPQNATTITANFTYTGGALSSDASLYSVAGITINPSGSYQIDNTGAVVASGGVEVLTQSIMLANSKASITQSDVMPSSVNVHAWAIHGSLNPGFHGIDDDTYDSFARDHNDTDWTSDIALEPGVAKHLYIILLSEDQTSFKRYDFTVTRQAAGTPTYTVTFDANGGSISPSSAVTGVDGKLSGLPTPTRNGYSFDGWYTLASGGAQVTTSTVFTQNATIYAHWTYTGGGGGTPGGGTVRYTITFNSNGGSAVSSQSITLGSMVTEPAEPKKDGFDFAGWYTSSVLTTQYDFSKTVTESFTLYAKWTEESATLPDIDVPLANPWVNPFTDVKSDDWFYGDVEYVHTGGLMIGTAADKFSPNLAVMRGMIVTVLYRQAGSPSVSALSNPFSDVAAGKYYTDAVKWAAANNIVSGYGGGKFGPEDNITREQLVTILMRYAGFMGMELPVMRPYETFRDQADMSNYAKEAIEAFFKAGVINGKGNGIFDPKGQATRAEVAAMLRRFMVLSE